MARTAARALAVVVAGGLLAGTFDILYAWLFWALKANVSMQRILQSVAAGLLGRGSFTGGTKTAALGLGLHYFIAVAMAVTYYAVARRWQILVRRAVLCGALYGALLYAIMNYIVVPLSAASPGSSDPLWVALTVGVHVLFVGIPIALASARAVNRS